MGQAQLIKKSTDSNWKEAQQKGAAPIKLNNKNRADVAWQKLSQMVNQMAQAQVSKIQIKTLEFYHESICALLLGLGNLINISYAQNSGRGWIWDNLNSPSWEGPISGSVVQAKGSMFLVRVSCELLEAWEITKKDYKVVIAEIEDASGGSSGINEEGDFGELLAYLREQGVCSLATFDISETDAEVSMQNIDNYQVASSDRKIIGFQPLSSMIVSQWAAHHLARKLYRWKMLFPELHMVGSYFGLWLVIEADCDITYVGHLWSQNFMGSCHSSKETIPRVCWLLDSDPWDSTTLTVLAIDEGGNIIPVEGFECKRGDLRNIFRGEGSRPGQSWAGSFQRRMNDDAAKFMRNFLEEVNTKTVMSPQLYAIIPTQLENDFSFELEARVGVSTIVTKGGTILGSSCTVADQKISADCKCYARPVPQLVESRVPAEIQGVFADDINKRTRVIVDDEQEGDDSVIFVHVTPINMSRYSTVLHLVTPSMDTYTQWLNIFELENSWALIFEIQVPGKCFTTLLFVGLGSHGILAIRLGAIIWDTRGSPLPFSTIVFLYVHHLEDKVIFKGGSIVRHPNINTDANITPAL